LVTVNPLDVLLWTFRRNEVDVVNLYDTLSSIMQISTGGNMLNFGYWDENTLDPYQAQVRLCRIVGHMAELERAHNVLDVGSGFSEPAIIWCSEFPKIGVICSNINLNQLKFAKDLIQNRSHPFTESSTNERRIELVNCTSSSMPFSSKFFDRIIALESAQHFKSLDRFVKECRKVLKDKGLLVIALPVVSQSLKPEIFKLGILSFTWSSQHYEFDSVREILTTNGFDVLESDYIGSKVFVPLADYYRKNREFLKSKIQCVYPSYVEKILYISMQKMKEVSKSGVIDYILLKCVAK
jgi:cyclopropane fatty-acyl-phospholipid synthase-like methyltransferase